MDDSKILSAKDLDTALAAQGVARRDKLQRTIEGKGWYWSDALLLLSSLCGVGAVLIDHSRGTWIIAANTLVVWIIVLSARRSRRIEAEKKLTQLS